MIGVVCKGKSTTKVVVTFYLRLRNEFQPFPAKFKWPLIG